MWQKFFYFIAHYIKYLRKRFKKFKFFPVMGFTGKRRFG